MLKKEALWNYEVVEQHSCLLGSNFTLLWHNSSFENPTDKSHCLELINR